MKTLIVLLWAFAFLFLAAVRDDAVLGAAEKVDSSECVANVYRHTRDYTVAVSSCGPVTGKSFKQIEEDLP